MTWLDGALRLLLRRRAAAAALLALVTAGSLVGASRLTVQGSIEAWFLEDDASLGRYHAFRERFGADEFVVVAAIGPGARTPAGLALMERVRRGAERLPEVHRTRWVTNAAVVQPRGDDALDTGPLAATLPTDPAGVDALWARAASLRAARGLVGDGPAPATSMLVELRREAQTIDGKLALVDGLRRALAAAGAGDVPDVEVVLSGPPVFDEAFVRHTERDLAALAPLGLALLLGVLWLSLRSLALALVPVGVVAAATCWLLGAMGLIGHELGITSSNLLCVVLAVGVADGVHLVSELRAGLARGLARDDAIRAAATGVFVPCTLTTATTALGMLSLCAGEILPIREFGLQAALGVALCWVATFTLAPLLASVVAGRAAPAPGPHWAARVGRLGRRGRLAVLWGAALVTAASLAGLARLEVGVNPVEYFRHDDPVRRATERIDATLGGTANLELWLRARGEAGLEDPAALALLEALRLDLERERGVSYSQSLVDPVSDLHRAFAGEDGLPASRELAAQYLLVLASDEQLGRLVQPDHRGGRLSLRTQMSMTDRPLEVIERVAARAADPALAAAGVDVEVTGYVHLMATMYDHLLRSQLRSLLLAFVTVTLCMVALARSLRLGLVSMVPNVLPLVVGAGLMGALGIRLDVGTVMIGSVVLGLVVDDTTHLLARLTRCLRAAPDRPAEDAVAEALGEVGRPLVTTSVALAAGFGALACGHFLVNVYFGLMSAVVVLVALVADLVVTPTLVVVLAPWLLGRRRAPEGERPGRDHTTCPHAAAGQPIATTSTSPV